jgi:fructose/tagatose bisphosphate aldolase
MAEETEIPMVPHQDHVDKFSTLKAQYTKNSYQREKQ